jgi:hypothetical protein
MNTALSQKLGLTGISQESVIFAVAIVLLVVFGLFVCVPRTHLELPMATVLSGSGIDDGYLLCHSLIYRHHAKARCRHP